MEDRSFLDKSKEIWVIKAAYPNNDTGKKYSDYAYAHSLKKYLERIGKNVIVQAYEEWDDDADADVVIVLRGHRCYTPNRDRKNCVYIMWVLSHPDKISDDEYNSYDLLCIGTIKKEFIQSLQQKVNVPIEKLLMCVDSEIFHPGEDPYGDKKYDWIFVGNSKSMKRKSVIWAINNNIPLKIWGRDWEKIEPDLSQYVVQDHILNDDLPELYRNAKITIDDHFEDMSQNGFINTRILESLACGLPVIADYSEVMPEMFGDAILYYTDEKSFVEQTRYALENYGEVKRKVMNISESIRQQYSFLSGAKRLDEFVKALKYEQKYNMEHLSQGKFEKISVNNRVLQLGEEIYEYTNKIICRKEEIREKEITKFQDEYRHMSWIEKCAFEALPDQQKMYFNYLVRVPVEYEVLEVKMRNMNEKEKKLGKERRELSEEIQRVYIEKNDMRGKLQKVYDEKSEINRKLQQTYSEKSEINRKLQITYDEKFERGVEIKRLKKEIEGIKKSKTYRLARWIGFPIRFIRKIIRKING